MTRTMKKNQSGFTLVEVLTVMVIITILASVSLPVMAGIVKHSRKSAYIDEARRVAEAFETEVMEEYAEGTFDIFEFAGVAYNKMNPATNPVAKRMKEGSYTPDAKIYEVGLVENTLEILRFEYHVAGYKIYLNFKTGEVTFK